MSAPDDVNSGGAGLWIAQNHDTVSSTSAGSLLQGTLIGEPGDFIPGTGPTASPTMLEEAVSSAMVALTPSTVGDGGNSVFFGEFVLNTLFPTFSPIDVQQTVSGGGLAALGFWGATSNAQAIWGSAGAIFGTSAVGGNSTDMTTINGFTVSGTTHDNVTFDVLSWNGGNHFGGGLTMPLWLRSLRPLTPTAFMRWFAGEVITCAADLVLYNVLSAGPLTDAADLATALHTSTVGNMLVGPGGGAIPGPHDCRHVGGIRHPAFRRQLRRC